MRLSRAIRRFFLTKIAGCIAYGLADFFQNFHTNTILSLWGSEEPYKGVTLQGMRSQPCLFVYYTAGAGKITPPFSRKSYFEN